MGGLMTPYEGEINLHGGVTVPYFVIGGGLLVLTEQGVENLIDAHFPSYPKEQLKGSQYYFEAGKHRGYMAEIVKDLYDPHGRLLAPRQRRNGTYQSRSKKTGQPAFKSKGLQP